ncbi:sugar 3,4-ketoisomerase [Elstera sp.]|jgi:hypothetical protein|uniref:sugar 3,4-ketoisomerase n=1 Tax=Elstera sp. TaxID=1916664 RepID=UPI0037C1383A
MGAQISPVPPKPAPLAGLDQIRLLSFPQFPAPGRVLTIFETGANLPIPIARVFTVASDQPDTAGGGHAHRWCSQVLVCLQGEIEFVGRDHLGGEVRHLLTHPQQAVLMPPTIWGEQSYRTTPALLMVFCDYPFAADDYIRDFDSFRAHRELLAAGA